MTDVSVIVPTYNHAHFLEDCLASIYQQKEVSFEIIVVDDGSTDSTAELIERHSERVRYIYQANAGLSAARNTGLRASVGRYIQFLDADDLLAPNCLSQKLQMIDRQQSKGILVCRSRLFSAVKANGSIVKSGYWRLYTSKLNIHLCRLNIAPPHAYFIPRSLLAEMDGFDESYKGCEDYDFWLRALGAGYDFNYCANALVYYRKHGNSMGNAKARAGIYPFDVRVHQKKHEGEYGSGVARLLDGIPGKLALADGALATALLIDAESNSRGQQQLFEIAYAQIESALGVLARSRVKLDLEATLYMKRILLKRAEVDKLGNTAIPRVIDKLAKACSSPLRTLHGIRMMLPITRYESQALMLASVRTVIGDVLVQR
jgi:GT2 family glycosyltransferase